MKPSLALLTLIATFALTSTSALAQSSIKHKRAAKTTAVKAAAQTHSAGAVAAATTISAAGSVILLADGIVANAAFAQVQSPAPGFEYER